MLIVRDNYSMHKNIYLLSYASGTGAADPGSSQGPLVLQQSPYLTDMGGALHWQAVIKPEINISSKFTAISHQCQRLAKEVVHLVQEKKFFTVLGGDHTCAIGTWSGAHHALKNQGPIGLIWIDAHMDSHTPETSLSGNIHGMPLACLLGYGKNELTQILDKDPKLQPEHVCLIGVRSFEEGEAELLKQLKVRIFYMDEVKQRGLDAVMKEAVKIVTQGTIGFGLSLDIDSIDPQDAPGTGAAEADGIRAKDLDRALKILIQQPKLIGIEIAEFDPHHDQNHRTEELIVNLIKNITFGR